MVRALTIESALVESARRIANLLAIVRAWKTTEVSLGGDLLDKHDIDRFMDRLETVRRCWLRHKRLPRGSCRTSCSVGCAALRIWPSSFEFLSYSGVIDPPWYAVGAFDGRQVTLDKEALRRQLDAPRNAEVRLCPHFEPSAVPARIAALPDTLAADDRQWITVYHVKDGKSAWVWPKGSALPAGLRDTKESPWRSGGLNVRVDFGRERESGSDTPTLPPQFRSIPPARYSDVHGQDAAVEAIRDLVELPLRHADLFARIGARPQAHGAILAGPPGTGKSLLARAVAGECGAHIEVVSGPSLLSKWVGETEAALRGIFERAREHAPAVILFDEVDCLGSSRASADTHHQKSTVTQLLALLDGLEERGQVFVLATTNRPEDIDAALRRPGRFDQVVWMGPPDEQGRQAIFLHHMQGLKLVDDIDRDHLAAELAVATPGFTGADIAYVCQRAALLCVKEACLAEGQSAVLAITAAHFREAITGQGRDAARKRHFDAGEANAALLANAMN